MNSITRHLNPRILYAEIKMERQKRRHAILLMEGSGDFRRFSKFFDHNNVSVVVCHGKRNVTDTIDISQNSGFSDCLGFIDLDFDMIDQCEIRNDDVITSSYHDFDVDVCRTDVVRRYLAEMAVPVMVEQEGGCDQLILSLLDALKPLSAMRYANERHNLSYDLSSLALHKFFDGRSIDVEAMIGEASFGKFASATHRAALKHHIRNYVSAQFDLWHFTNGHDLIAAIGIALQSRIAGRAIPQTKAAEVERHLRLAFDHSDFDACGLNARVSAWESQRKGVTLLKKVA
jgi:hypothetical protein